MAVALFGALGGAFLLSLGPPSSAAAAQKPPKRYKKPSDALKDLFRRDTQPPARPATSTPPAPRPMPAAPASGAAEATYGYTKANPVRVRPPGAPAKGAATLLDGARAAREYLGRLRDARGRPMKWKRLGCVGPAPDGSLLDRYELFDADGYRYILYVDVYHRGPGQAKARAPRGLRLRGSE